MSVGFRDGRKIVSTVSSSTVFQRSFVPGSLVPRATDKVDPPRSSAVEPPIVRASSCWRPPSGLRSPASCERRELVQSQRGQRCRERRHVAVRRIRNRSDGGRSCCADPAGALDGTDSAKYKDVAPSRCFGGFIKTTGSPPSTAERRDPLVCCRASRSGASCLALSGESASEGGRPWVGWRSRRKPR